MLSTRHATITDLPAIMDIMEVAVAFMQTHGNPNQWVNGYPSEELISKDIADHSGYVVIDEMSVVVGYFVFKAGPDSTYARIYNGWWLNDNPYHVVHRIAAHPNTHGVFSAVMHYCLSAGSDIRIDTHRDNRIMQHLVDKYGFVYCGIIHTSSGDERLAYQLVGNRQGKE